ncbi:MAG: hypothetical protein HQ517_13680 [SAR324 cluster bacterium]|nr:hypothetical protein [SAR324 cluster bacterium]
MNTISVGISVAGFAVVFGSWVQYFSTIPKMKVPINPIAHVITQSFGIVLAAFSLIRGYQGNGTLELAALPTAILSILMGSTFFWLLSQRKTPVGDIKVKVGDRLLPFTASTSGGNPFHTDEFMGKRILLKFFRGGW